MGSFGKKHKKQNDEENVIDDIFLKVTKHAILNILAPQLQLDLDKDQIEPLIEQAIKQAYQQFSK
jgi:hypothetical protein